jgi:hypothetical protein
MTGTTPDDLSPPDDLAARVFRALYPEFDLHDMAGTYLAVPAGTPWFTAPAIGEIARQISDRDRPAQASPDDRPRPDLPRRP